MVIEAFDLDSQLESSTIPALDAFNYVDYATSLAPGG